MSKQPRSGREEILECQVMWEPDSKKNTQMDRFRAAVGAACGLALENYDDLYHWSVESYPDFWAEFWKFSGIVFSRTYDEVVDTSKGIADVPEWFKGSRLNYAENLLRHKENDRVALYAAREGKEEIVKVTFEELRQQVALFAAAMRKMGVKQGDRVVGYLPNGVHAVEAMLAAASIGAIWSSTSPDFGVNSLGDEGLSGALRTDPSQRSRRPSMTIIHSFWRRAAPLSSQPLLRALDHVAQWLKAGFLGMSLKLTSALGLAVLVKVVQPATRPGLGKAGVSGESAPCGQKTTGQPPSHSGASLRPEFREAFWEAVTCILPPNGAAVPARLAVHGTPRLAGGEALQQAARALPGVLRHCRMKAAAGTLIQHLKEHILHGNMGSGDILLYYTTVGWMMWNWMVSALATGAAVVLYDGSPLVPTPNVLWDLIDRIGITILGTGAKWLAILEEKNMKPVETHSLQTLHTVLSTGSSLKAQSYDYVYRCIKNSVLLGSISGGTDIISCFMGQNFSIPVYKGEIQARNLGMAVEAWNEEGKAIWGESGELVCTKPIPCQPTCFWNDENGSKYRKAYFSRFPGVWAHGDYCRINPKTGGIIMLGRSDGTLNPNGVRFGSSEIYNIVEAFEEVMDSLCVPQYNKDGEERVLLFLKMASGHTFGPELVKSIRNAIRVGLSARHVPSLILETKGIPYTLNGKKVEVAVKQIIAGKGVEHRGAFSNPETLDLYRDIPELQDF
ncbi:acetoacetyl-CoA synthetase [Eumetopias jubatus]|uniref:acetoacetyl-CoA synthetase n=1 Tax=Eumetopias jubatus TaxID=34886 RepID=UPI00101690BF|nr:acetoacetyl-CoA synthetase [Eumetopias jubatus]